MCWKRVPIPVLRDAMAATGPCSLGGCAFCYLSSLCSSLPRWWEGACPTSGQLSHLGFLVCLKKASSLSFGTLRQGTEKDLGLGRSFGVGNGNPLQYSCLENSMDRGAWWATVHGLQELDMTEHTHLLNRYR